MSGGKGQSSPRPKLAGINYLSLPTGEADQPHTYFAGARALNVSWLMTPVISKVKKTPTQGGKGK